MKEYKQEIEEMNESAINSEEKLPSRKKRHPKPKSFLEKPIFSLIIFLLFVSIIGGIFIYYNYHQDDNQKQTSQNSVTKEEDQSSQIDSDTKDLEDQTIPEPEQTEVIADQNQGTIPTTTESSTSEPSTSSSPTSAPTPESTSSDQEEQSTPIHTVTYTIQKNDTLYSIAKKYYKDIKTGIELIKTANGLKNNQIVSSSKLIIPDPTKTP